jgi:hypothetical protein
MLHYEIARAAENLMMHKKCGADCQTCIAGGRLYEYALERCAIENAAVGDAIESHAARET